MSFCDGCDFYDSCEYADQTCFCEDCNDFNNCRIQGEVTCEAGYYIECNNGFEEKSYCYDEGEEENDEEIY